MYHTVLPNMLHHVTSGITMLPHVSQHATLSDIQCCLMCLSSTIVPHGWQYGTSCLHYCYLMCDTTVHVLHYVASSVTSWLPHVSLIVPNALHNTASCVISNVLHYTASYVIPYCIMCYIIVASCVTTLLNGSHYNASCATVWLPHVSHHTT